MIQSLGFSRRWSSASTAAFKKSERFSPSRRTASIRANVPSGKRPGILSKFSFGRPMRDGLADISIADKLISPIDVTDIRYIVDIRNGDNPMTDRYSIARGDGYAVEIVKDAQGAFSTRKDAASALCLHLEADRKELGRALAYARRVANGAR